MGSWHRVFPLLLLRRRKTMSFVCRLRPVSLSLENPWGWTQNKWACGRDCERDIAARGISRSHAHDPTLAFAAFFFVFFPTDFRAKERLLAVYSLCYSVVLLTHYNYGSKWRDTLVSLRQFPAISMPPKSLIDIARWSEISLLCCKFWSWKYV